MPWTRTTLILSSHRRHQRILTLMAPFSLKLCNNNSVAGLTTVLLKVWVMQVVVSKIRLLSEACKTMIDDKLLRTTICDLSHHAGKDHTTSHEGMATLSELKDRILEACHRQSAGNWHEGFQNTLHGQQSSFMRRGVLEFIFTLITDGGVCFDHQNLSGS